MRAIGYIRVSTAGQVDGVSLEAQRRRIAAWCEAHGADLVSIHEDAGISGTRRDRPGLAAAIDAVTNGGGVLVVYSLSRFARSTRDTLDLAEQLERGGADLVSLSESIDTTSAAGKMVFRMLAVLAEFERDQIAERTTAALAHKRAKGQKTGGVIPFGFDLADDGTTLVPNEAEQRTIELIDELRAGGMTYRAIGAELERRGIATKTGGARWSPKVIRSLAMRAA